MSYAPTTDFLGLLRQTPGGVRTERMPGLDYVTAALARAGMFQLSVSDTPPTLQQNTTAWFRPATPSWASEGTLYLWEADTAQYVPATPMLWSELFITTAAATNVQHIVTPGPVNVGGTVNIVLVDQPISAPITLVMPLASAKIGDVLISDWKGDAGQGNTITVTLTGSDVFPGGLTTWQIAGNTGSIFLRPAPGLGYTV
jgi:hypothetical protein